METMLAVRPEFVRPRDLPVVCSDANLLEAVNLWLVGERDDVILAKLGCADDPRYAPLSKWTNLGGWHYLADVLREEVLKVARGRMQRIMNRCFSGIEERIEHGDPQYNEAGVVVGYRGMRGKDLGNLAALFWDRLRESEKVAEEGLSAGERMAVKEIFAGLREMAKAKQGKLIEHVAS
jgi:hypothetical protein